MTMILCSFISSRWPLMTSIALKWPWLTLLKMTVNDRSWHEIFKAKMSRYVRYLKYSLNFVKNDIFWIALVLWGNFKNFEYKMTFYRNSGAKDLVSSSTNFYKKVEPHLQTKDFSFSSQVFCRLLLLTEVYTKPFTFHR